MNDLIESLGKHLSAARLNHETELGVPDVLQIWRVTLRAGKQQIVSELILDAGRRLFLWRAPLLKGAKKRSRLFFWVYGDAERAMAFHALAEALPFARLRLDREDGAVLEVAMPLPQSISEEAFAALLAEMQHAFALRGIVRRGLDGGEMEWSPGDLPSQADHFPPEPTQQARADRPQPQGRIAEIEQAISKGEIALARRLASGEDIDVPDTI